MDIDYEQAFYWAEKSAKQETEYGYEELSACFLVGSKKNTIKALEYLGYYDAFRAIHVKENGYTFWDYAGAAYKNDMGMRIDYLWLNSYAMDKLQTIEVDKSPRSDTKPSDHTVLKAVLKK